MTSQIPTAMTALALSKYSKPSEYNIATLPVPEISKPDELLVKVHAAAVNPIDVKLASGLGKMLDPGTSFPYKIGYDVAGTVVAIGTGVTAFKVGDEIYSRVGEHYRGTIAQYALTSSGATAKKPKSLSFSQAASIPLAAQTALQALDRGESELPGGLRGKTVFIPAGLSGTGSFAVQIAKCLGAGKVITTVSTAKVVKIKELLGAAVPDQVIDYKKENVNQTIGKGSVDFLFDTQQSTLSALPLLKKGGMIVSISTVPSGNMMKQNYPNLAGWLFYVLTLADLFFRKWTSWHGVKYEYMFIRSRTKDLDRLATWVDEGRITPVIGKQVRLSDLEGVRAGCQEVYDGKGGVGKLVIDVD